MWEKRNIMLIGTDIGTSGTKTVLFDLNGNAVASDTQEYPLYQPKNGWAEQDPEDWWNAVATSIRNVIAKSGVSASEIKGIGLSGQMHGLVMLDKNDKVLRRSIIWCDQRTAKECEEITAKVGYDNLIRITANPALPGFTLSKLIWVRNHEPENYALFIDEFRYPCVVNPTALQYVTTKPMYNPDQALNCTLKADLGDGLDKYHELWQQIRFN